MHYLTCALDICVYWGKYDLWLNRCYRKKPLYKQHANVACYDSHKAP